jgi:hypothetical protein
MIDGFIEEQIRRNNRNQIIWAALFLVVVIGAFLLAGNYYYNFFFGPFKVDASQVAAYQAGNLPQQYYITVTGRDVEDTGYDMYHTDSNGNKTTDASYLALLVGDRLLLVKVPPNTIQNATTTMTGALRDLPSEEQSYIIQNLESQYPDIKGAFLPVMLDATNFKTGGTVGLVLGILAIGVCLFFLIRGLMRSDPDKHPFMKQLARYGQPEFISSSIDMEMAGEHTRIGSLHISPHWLVQTSLTVMKVMRMEDLVWEYKHVLQHRTYGIPTAKTFTAIICDRNGMSISVGAREAVIDQLLIAVKQYAPWMIAGYTKELANAWRKDRAQLIAAVDANKQGVQPS